MLLTFVFISFNICIVIKTIKSKACDHLKESMKETLDDVKKTLINVSNFSTKDTNYHETQISGKKNHKSQKTKSDKK